MPLHIDHVEYANRFVGVNPVADGSFDQTRDYIAAAQVHATLALVEQQVLANLIAYAQLLEAQYAEAAKHEVEFDWQTRADSEERHGIVLSRIREGLGL